MTKVYTFGPTLPRRKLETSRQFAERITACRDPKDDKFLELTGNGHAD